MARISSNGGRSVLNPVTIAGGYAVISALWIIFSDQILRLIGADMSIAHVTRIQTLKGILYISLTAGFIYLLISIAARQVNSSRDELDQDRQRYFQLFETTGAIILIIEEKDGAIVEANAAAERFYGWSRGQLVGRRLSELESPGDGAPPEEAGLPGAGAFTYARHRVAGGGTRDVTLNATSIVVANRRLEFLLINDVTERRQLERQLRQSLKMEAVGRLTAGIAHDLNNVLTVVMADADLIAAEMTTAGQDVRDDLDDLRNAARRGAGMIRKLLSFSRGTTLRTVTADLAGAVKELVPGLTRTLPEGIELRVAHHGSGLVQVDPDALDQIVANLVSNARDAMPGGGVIGLETGLETLVPAEPYSWVRPGKYVSLRVTDTGRGMDQETLARMFDPFFTTKTPSEGTGLGLAMVYGLVKQHEGFVLAQSAPGTGTTVSVYFPLAPRLGQAAPAAPAVANTAGGGGETILLVEDEDALRRAGQRILERLGYVVITAPNGQRGLEVLEEKGDSIDLVITDLVMPRVGGRAFYDAAIQRRKNLRFLFTSGYAPSGPGQETPLPDVPFIQKPWTFEELKRKVREVLGGAPSTLPSP
jgi:PAS domain S-box-containing protein